MFQGKVRIQLGAGDDVVELGSDFGPGLGIETQNTLVVNGGSGFDFACLLLSGNIYANPPTLISLETIA